MGLLPYQFYRISPLEFGLMAQGYKNRQVMEMKLNRNVIYTMAKLWGSNTPNDPADFWDLGDKVETDMDEVAKLFDALREKDKEKQTNG